MARGRDCRRKRQSQPRWAVVVAASRGTTSDGLVATCTATRVCDSALRVPPTSMCYRLRRGTSHDGAYAEASRTTRLDCCARAAFVPYRRSHLRRSLLITTASLKTQSWKDLADMAKSKGLSGWHSMRKDELVRALVRAAQKRARLRAAAGVHKSAKASKALRRSTTMKSHSAHVKGHASHSNGTRTNGVRINGSSKQTVSARASNGKTSQFAPRQTAKQLRIAERIQRVNAERERLKDLSGAFTLAKSSGK